MTPSDSGQVAVPPARAGRPRNAHHPVAPDALVRVEVRIPASVAARLYARANGLRQPVSRTAAELIDSALSEGGGDATA